VTGADHIREWVNRDEILGHSFKGVPENGIGKELKDGEEYELTLKMKYRAEVRKQYTAYDVFCLLSNRRGGL
jgi:hypothetical protein